MIKNLAMLVSLAYALSLFSGPLTDENVPLRAAEGQNLLSAASSVVGQHNLLSIRKALIAASVQGTKIRLKNGYLRDAFVSGREAVERIIPVSGLDDRYLYEGGDLVFLEDGRTSSVSVRDVIRE